MTALKKPEFTYSSTNLPNVNSCNLWGLHLINQHSGGGMSPKDGHIVQTVLNLGRTVASKSGSYDCNDAHGRHSFGEGFPDYRTDWSESLEGFYWYADLALAAEAFRKIYGIAEHLAGVVHIGYRKKYWDVIRLNARQMDMLTTHRNWRERFVLEAADDMPERSLIVFTQMKRDGWYRITLDSAVLADLRAMGDVAPRRFRALPRWLDNLRILFRRLYNILVK